MSKSRLPAPVFLAAESLSLLGNSAFLVVFPWLVLFRTGSATQTSLVTALVTIPTAVATLAAGRAIDRFGRKRSSVLATCGCALAAAGFGLLSGAEVLTVGVLIGLGMFAEFFVTPSTTARDALMGEIADAGGVSLERLAGTRQVLFSVAYVVGPAAAGVLLATVTPIVVMWAVAGVWVLAAVLTTALPPGAPRSTDQTDQARGHTRVSVWAVVRSRPAIWAAVVIGFGSSVITRPMTSVILPAHFRSLHEPQLYGFAVAAFAVGSILGALAYAAIGTHARRNVYTGAVLVATAGIAAFAVLPTFWVLAIGLGIGGMGSGLLAPLLLVAVTKNTAEEERGRALGVFNAASMGASPIGLGLLSLVLAGSNVHAGALAVLAVWIAVAIFALVRKATIVGADPAEAIGAHH